jgi:hypothetical protein
VTRSPLGSPPVGLLMRTICSENLLGTNTWLEAQFVEARGAACGTVCWDACLFRVIPLCRTVWRVQPLPKAPQMSGGRIWRKADDHPQADI